ncbi:MAG: hypothetical protein ABI432_14175 [Flavobacteriales bacterium]
MKWILPIALLCLVTLATGCKKDDESDAVPDEDLSAFGQNNGWTTTLNDEVQFSMASAPGNFFRSYKPNGGIYRFGRSTDDGASWTSWVLPHSNSEMLFVDALLGLSRASNIARRTQDGGHTWNELPLDPGRMRAVPGTNRMFGFLYNSTYFTEDLGATWADAGSSGPGNVVFDMHFVNSDTGYAALYGGTLRRSTDGGLNWVTLLDLGGHFKKVVHRNGLDGVALHKPNDGVVNLLHTTDSWNTYSTTSVGSAIGETEFLWEDANGTLYAGSGLFLHRSTDNGTTWSVDLRAPIGNSVGGITRSGDELWVWCSTGFAHKTVPL